ncbi:MAG: alkaline phosphatase family protein [Desulfovibrio sp.]|jgi:predicted AlkP superfamily pyrophosphatase or phosphodiesterase|nr:alkaline phosphatase family protein [Desulfovibrio sp.]
MKNFIFVLLDGLGAGAARRCMSCLAALEEAGIARYRELATMLPPLSRPVYATLLSGQKPAESGILHNDNISLCPIPTIFHWARQHGLVTAAASYAWISELCNRAPFVAERDRFTQDAELPISCGLFYSSDAYPDDELFRDAEWLRLKFSPHLLLVHSMGIDYAGHMHGASSSTYRNAARAADGLLARYLPRWLEKEYAVLVTSDHGMDIEGSHCDATGESRSVPLWLVGAPQDCRMPQSQTELAEIILTCLELASPTLVKSCQCVFDRL